VLLRFPIPYKGPSGFRNPEGPGREEAAMAEPAPVPPISTFVVRFWREWSAAGSRWRGRIEHVQSGEGTMFLDLDGMLDFIRRFGVMVEEEPRSTRGS
jgi:hypothetical protein